MAVSDSEESAKATSKVKDDDPELNDEEEEAEEYEIEEVLDARRGFFPEGRMGYFVKWKGYGPEDNSWVDEQDAVNAQELVNEFWRKNPHKKKAVSASGRKSIDKKSPKKSRKSTEDTSDVGEISSKKRGRKSASHQAGSDDEMDVDDEEKPVKRSKKNAAQSKANAKKLKTPSPEEEEVQLGDMKKYMNVASWEGLVKTIDTVEKANDNELKVFFTLNSGEKIMENAAICRRRFPQKLLEFYEANLKWRHIDEPTDK